MTTTRIPLRNLRHALLGACLLLAASASAGADAPELISYQGVLLQDDGVVVPDGLWDLRFRLYPQEAAGTAVFEQTLTVDVRDGLYNVILSTQNGYDLSDVIEQNANLFMEVTVLNVPDPQNGGQLTDVVLTPRQQLASVPYALNAGQVPPPSVRFFDAGSGVSWAPAGTIVAGPLTVALPADGLSRDLVIRGKCALLVIKSNSNKTATLGLQGDDGSGFATLDSSAASGSSAMGSLWAPLSVMGFLPQAASGASYEFQLVASSSHYDQGNSYDCKLLVEAVPVP